MGIYGRYKSEFYGTIRDLIEIHCLKRCYNFSAKFLLEAQSLTTPLTAVQIRVSSSSTISRGKSENVFVFFFSRAVNFDVQHTGGKRLVNVNVLSKC